MARHGKFCTQMALVIAEELDVHQRICLPTIEDSFNQKNIHFEVKNVVSPLVCLKPQKTSYFQIPRYDFWAPVWTSWCFPAQWVRSPLSRLVIHRIRNMHNIVKNDTFIHNNERFEKIFTLRWNAFYYFWYFWRFKKEIRFQDRKMRLLTVVWW